MSTAAADAEARARVLLAAHPEGRMLAYAPFQPIASGAFNRCWRADTPRGAYFVRLADEAARGLGAGWESEAVLLGIAGEAGVAPRALLTVPGAGLLASEFLPGSTLTTREARAPARLAAIGRLLRRVHELPPSPAIRRLDFEVQARTLEAQLDPADVARFRTQSSAVFERLESERVRAVPCHNDVHAANLLLSASRLVLVDWEYCGLGDPIFDLAGLANHLALDAAQRALLLGAYGSPVGTARLDDAAWAYDYVQWLWYRAARVARDEGATALAEAAARLDRRLSKVAGDA